MAISTSVVTIDQLRTLAHGSISGSYAKVGSSFANEIRLINFVNNTDGDMLWSIDGVNDYLFTAAGSFQLYDLCTNRTGLFNQWVFPIGTQFWVKQSTAPSKNSVYIQCLG